MLDIRMKEVCRICGRELCGNQRRWIFHPASKLNLQVVLSHALGREVTRDGRGEFACSKCTFMLHRMYRFDTVIARVEALSIERLQRLFQEKHRLRQCVGGLYRKTNGGEEGAITTGAGNGEGMVDMSGLTHAKYCALLQDDLVYSLYESWADEGLEVVGRHHHHTHHQNHHHPQCPVLAAGQEGRGTPRRCRGCAALRVADSDYEAVCKVPRKLARSMSCGPSTRYSASLAGGSAAGLAAKEEEEEEDGGEGSEEPPSSLTLVPGSSSQPPSRASDSERTLAGHASSSPSLESLDVAGGECGTPSSRTSREAGQGFLRDEMVATEDQVSDSLSEDNLQLGGPPGGSSGRASRLSLALGLAQNCSIYRPVLSPKGSRLPVLLRQSPGNGASGLGFPDPLVGMSYEGLGEDGDIHSSLPGLDAPLVRLDNSGLDDGLDLAEMEELWHDVYKECPPPRPHQTLIEEQQSQLNQYECAAGQCVSELHKAQLQVQSLQNKIHESEANNTKLQEKLNEMEVELRSIQQAAQSQERTILGLTETVSTKDSEAQELYQLIEGQNATLCKLREMAQRTQLPQTKVPEVGSEAASLAQLRDELVGEQSSLFSLGLELEASQRRLRLSQRGAEDLARAKDRLNTDLQVALQHREVTEKHNQDLRSALQRSQSELQAKQAALAESEAERHSQLQDRDRSITQLKLSLQDKERQLQEYSELLEPVSNAKPRDALLEKLRERIKDRDRALEHSIDEKFRCLEEREAQVRRLQLALREKERDLERLRSILANNEETITTLDALVRGKELELEQAAEASRNLQWLKRQSEERETHTLRERDTLITQLQTALHTRSQEAQDLTSALLAQVCASPSQVVEELKGRLALKEKLFQELLSDRGRQALEHQGQVQDLLSTISTKDQNLQDCSDRLSRVIDERTGQLQELRRQLLSQDRELGELRRARERDNGGETERLQSLLKEKEAFIQELMHGQEDAMEDSGIAEASALQDELQLVVKKEREAQRELSALRVSLAQAQKQAQKQGAKFERTVQGADSKDCADNQGVLEQLVSEYHRLNDALRAEKRLYQSLTHIHTSRDSSEKTQALHRELDTVQALRGQLEEVLTRTRSTALAVERERVANRLPDAGGGGDGRGSASGATGGAITNSV